MRTQARAVSSRAASIGFALLLAAWHWGGGDGAQRPAGASGGPARAPGTAYAVVDTGQNRCYDESREIACPGADSTFEGQDAQHAGLQPDYRDNGDGTVSDLTSGLVWQKSPGGKVTWSQASAGADSLRLAGHDDWRLPTIKELYSLIDFSGVDPSGATGSGTSGLVPFIDTEYFDFDYGDTAAGERIIDAQYWSATTYVGTTMNGKATVFGVNFADGRIKGYPRDRGPRGSVMTEFVRYVRGNPAYGFNQFAGNGDGTVTDLATGLMWAQADSGRSCDWRGALGYARDLILAGHDDWRLPNAKELQSIVDYARAPDVTSSPAIDPVFECTGILDEAGVPNYPFYWTSTTHANTSRAPGTFAVYVAFGEGLGFMESPPGSGIRRLLDVHGAGAQRSDPKAGDPADWPTGNGPQGDVVRIHNYARAVRDLEAAATATAPAPTALPPTLARPTAQEPTAVPEPTASPAPRAPLALPWLGRVAP